MLYRHIRRVADAIGLLLILCALLFAALRVM